MRNSNAALQYRPDIDGIRAVAVTVVIIFHAFGPILPGGFIGVDMFFVISGYLISTIILKEIDNRIFSIVRFYDRRIRRVFPALIAVFVFTLLFGYWVLYRTEFWTLGWHVAGSAAFIENFVLWHESGYFDTASESKPLLHLWSLAIEEQFYLLWPLLLYVVWRLRIGFLATISVIGLCSFAYGVYLTHADVAAAYYSPAGRVWELMIGGLLAYITLNHPNLIAHKRNLQSIVGFAAIGCALVLIDATSSFPGFWALLPTIGTFLIIAAGPDAWLNRNVLSTRPFVLCGLISYPLYLWHWPILAFLTILSLGQTWTFKLLAVLLTICLAILTYRFIERPFRRGSGSPARAHPQAVWLAGGLAAFGILGAAIGGLRLDPRLADVIIPTRTEWDFLVKLSGNTDPNVLGIYKLNEGRPHESVFIGDSQLAQFAERLSIVGRDDPTANSAVLYIGGGCIPIRTVKTDDLRRAKCQELIGAGLDYAMTSTDRNVVFGGLWPWYFMQSDAYVEDAGYRYPVVEGEGRRRALAALEDQLKEVAARGKQPFLMIGNFSNDLYNPGYGKARLFSLSPRSPKDTVRIDPAQLALRDELLAIAKRTGSIALDPYDQLCSDGHCRWAEADGTPIFKDKSHFNPDWAMVHTGFIDRALMETP